MQLTYPFTEEQMAAAAKEWGCNCGPSALAFALQTPLETVRTAIPDFESKRYTSPTMMLAALTALGVVHSRVASPSAELMFAPNVNLVRVQWTGAWTKPKAHPKAAYAHTHWIVAWAQSHLRIPLIFDCNGGIRRFESWVSEILPHLLPKKGDGGWFPTHILRLST